MKNQQPPKILILAFLMSMSMVITGQIGEILMLSVAYALPLLVLTFGLLVFTYNSFQSSHKGHRKSPFGLSPFTITVGLSIVVGKQARALVWAV